MSAPVYKPPAPSATRLQLPRLYEEKGVNAQNTPYTFLCVVKQFFPLTRQFAAGLSSRIQFVLSFDQLRPAYLKVLGQLFALLSCGLQKSYH